MSPARMESPEYVRLSTAAAIALGLERGRFYLNAYPYCINLLLHFSDGCKANCLYCGQAREIAKSSACKTLIRVDWPLYELDEVIERYMERFAACGCSARPYRVCVATITNSRAVEAEIEVIRRVWDELRVPISALVTPTLFGEEEFRELKLVDGKGAKPAKVLKKARELLPPDALVTTEVGQCQMWASLHFDVLKPNTFLTSGGLGTMGFGFPAAIGAKVAKPDVPVMDIAGDGSFGMTENSLATSVTENIPVIVLILDNRALGMIVQWQRMFYGRRYMASDLRGIPDFVKLAQAYGAQGIRAESVEDAEAALRYALKSDVTTVIDLIVSPEEDVLPFVAPGSSLREMIL